MSRSLTNAEVNHLRRMVAWVRGEYFLTPEEVVEVVRDNAAVLGEPSDEAKARLVAWYGEKKKVPNYIHAAVKALTKTIKEADGDVMDAHAEGNRLTVEPLKITGPFETEEEIEKYLRSLP